MLSISDVIFLEAQRATLTGDCAPRVFEQIWYIASDVSTVHVKPQISGWRMCTVAGWGWFATVSKLVDMLYKVAKEVTFHDPKPERSFTLIQLLGFSFTGEVCFHGNLAGAVPTSAGSLIAGSDLDEGFDAEEGYDLGEGIHLEDNPTHLEPQQFNGFDEQDQTDDDRLTCGLPAITADNYELPAYSSVDGALSCGAHFRCIEPPAKGSTF